MAVAGHASSASVAGFAGEGVSSPATDNWRLTTDISQYPWPRRESTLTIFRNEHTRTAPSNSMRPEVAIFLGVLFLAIFAVGAYFAHQAQLRRQRELAALAARLGYQFDPAKDSTHDERYGHFGAFKQGHTRYAYNTLVGRLEVDGDHWPVQMGDYHYCVTHSNGKQTTTTTYRFSYALVETPHLGAPPLFVRREGLFDKLGGFLGFDDIDFESAEFSDRFHVKSSDKRFAYDVLHPRMMEFLLDGDPPKIDFQRAQCCLIRGTKTWTPDQFAATLDWAGQFFALWPKHLASVLEGNEQSG